MSETSSVILAFLGGCVLGAMFFGGLWWTIRKGVASPLPALWFSGSLLIRMFLLLTGFYYVTHGDWARMASCLTGLLLARLAVTRMIPVRKEGAS